MMILLLETGIRISELLSLSIHDINMKERELRIQTGKGDKSRLVPFQKLVRKSCKHTWQSEEPRPRMHCLFHSKTVLCTKERCRTVFVITD